MVTSFQHDQTGEMRSQPLARLGLALTILLASTSLALLVPASAQAYSGDAITISNASTSIVLSGASREVHIAFDVAFADPVNGTGDLGLAITTHEVCGSSSSSSSITSITGSQSVALAMTIPAQGWVDISITPNDGNGAAGPPTSLTAYPAPQDSTAPVAVVHPDAGGASGFVTVTTGPDLVNFTVVSGLWDGGSFPSGTVTSIAACTSADIPFSGLAPQEVFEVHSTDLLGQPIATYTAPTPVLIDVATPGSAASTEPAAAVDELAYTGIEKIWPPLTLGVLLLGVGSTLILVRRRSAS